MRMVMLAGRVAMMMSSAFDPDRNGMQMYDAHTALEHAGVSQILNIEPDTESFALRLSGLEARRDTR